jgi:hypothetical protein
MHIASRDTVATKERPGRKAASRATTTFSPMPEFMRTEHTPCSETQYRDFFVHSYNGRQGAMYNELAKQVCSTCPFRFQCAEWAWTNRRRLGRGAGVWGGMDDNDRGVARRKAVRRAA